MDQYEIMFDGEVDTDALRQALAELGIPCERVLMASEYDPHAGAGIPAAMVVPGEEGQGFGTTLNAYADLIQITGLSELELARFLAPRLGLRCLVDDGTKHPDRWVFVAQDGSYGKVITDEDAAEEGDLRIVHATEPIAGAPELPVVPEPDWAR